MVGLRRAVTCPLHSALGRQGLLFAETSQHQCCNPYDLCYNGLLGFSDKDNARRTLFATRNY